MRQRFALQRVLRARYTRLGEKLRIIFPSVSFLLFERER